MSLTITKVHENVVGNSRDMTFDVTLDNSYVTGGYAITAATLGLLRILGVQEVGGNAAAGVLMFAWDTTNSKLLALYPTGGSTAPAALADPISKSGASTASAVDATTPNIVAGRGKEVANASDLSTMTVRLRVYGV